MPSRSLITHTDRYLDHLTAQHSCPPNEQKPKLILSLFTISIACTLNGVAFAQAKNTKSAEDANIKQVSQFTGGKSEQTSGPAPGVTKDGPEEGGLKSSSGSLCEVNYSINNGTISTGWINLGKVYFPEKRKDCKQKAIDNCRKEQKIKALLPSYAPVGSQNMQKLAVTTRKDDTPWRRLCLLH